MRMLKAAAVIDLLVSALAVMLIFPAQATSRASLSIQQRRDALKRLLDEQWQYTLREGPETATVFGDYRYNDRWSDISLRHQAQQNEEAKNFLVRFESIDATGFPEQEQLNLQLMIRQLKDQIEGYQLKIFEMPVDQFGGLQITLPALAATVPTDSTAHYEDYIARLNAIPTLIDQLIEVLIQGKKDKLMPPRILLEKVVVQCRSIAAVAGMQNAFVQPVANFPKTIPQATQARLRAALVQAVDTKVRPAYQKLARFIETEYVPAGQTKIGIWALPNGDAMYRYFIRTQTTTEKSPDEIYNLGIQQVREIEKEQTALALKLGGKDLKSFRQSLKTNPKLYPSSRERLLALYRKYITQMQAQLPKLFGILPKSSVEVVPVETFREKQVAAAEYLVGTPDGSRPGRVYVNTGDYRNDSIIGIEYIAYHEGVPGHHMQLSIAQELPSLPPFRQHAFFTAFIEGWALYAEGLGKEVGLYQDPYSDFGRLGGELDRACRLVLDTGVHYKHWTREQMVEFFREHSNSSESNIQAEVDRYIAWPGQALAYKLGELEFLELRERADRELGAKFDIRAFHDEVLKSGALPLDVLDARMNQWIAKMKMAHPKAKQ